MRRAPAAFLASLLGLPSVGAALVALATPPLSRHLPRALVALAASAAAPLFDAVSRLPPDSIAGRAFYGSYEPLARLLGDGALAAHAALLAAPALLAAVIVWRKTRPLPVRSAR